MEDPFDTLGIAPTFDLDLVQVEKRVRDLSRVLHPDRHVASSPAERRMALSRAVEVNAAFRVVRDPIARAEALFRRRGVAVGETLEPKADPEFLLEMMELREALAEAKVGGDAVGIERLTEKVGAKQEAAFGKLRAGFAGAWPCAEGAAKPPEPKAGPNPDVAKLVPLLGELRYYRRFLDEVSALDGARGSRAPEASGPKEGAP
jgi:molecular chaperone HscB